MAQCTKLRQMPIDWGIETTIHVKKVRAT